MAKTAFIHIEIRQQTSQGWIAVLSENVSEKRTYSQAFNYLRDAAINLSYLLDRNIECFINDKLVVSSSPLYRITGERIV